MRILRLDLGSTMGTVDLHPFVSIIHGLADDRRTSFSNAVRSLARGVDAGLGGLIEDRGSLIELPGLDGNLGTFTTEDIGINVDGRGLGADQLPALRAELDQVAKQAQIDAVHVEEIRADLTPSALAMVQRLRDRLAGVEPVSEAELSRDRHITEIQAATEAMQALPPVLRESRDDVAPLVARWEAYTSALTEARPHLEALTNRVQSAEAALTRAVEAVTAAQAEAVPVVLAPSEDARVDQLTEIYFDPKAKKKQWNDELEAELDALLAKVNQPTYTAYAMYRMSPQASPESLAALDAAQQALEARRVDVEEARAEYEIDPVAFKINGEFDDLKAEAREHLGAMLPDDLGAALSGLVTERENPEWRAIADELGSVLVSVGALADGSADPATYPDLGARWIRDALAVPDETGPTREDIEAQLAAAERTFHRHAKAMARIDRLEAVAAESASKARELSELIASIEAGHEAPTDVFGAIKTLADRVRSEAGAACPLILEGEFADLDDAGVIELLEQCETLGHDLQLIVISDRAAASTWAREVGLRRALRSTLITQVG